MASWSTAGEIAKDSGYLDISKRYITLTMLDTLIDIFLKLVFTLFGVYVWELFMTWDFEWSLVTRRRTFRWPLRCITSKRRVTIFFSNVLIRQINCRVPKFMYGNTTNVTLIKSGTIHFQLEIGELGHLSDLRFVVDRQYGNPLRFYISHAANFSRIALWERRRSVIVVLGILCLAHWTLLYRTMFIVVSQWEPTMKACVVVQTNPSMLNITFFFTMGFDFVILIFTAIALLGRHSARTDLWKLLFQDGLVYFLLSFSTNCIPAVLNVLNLNNPSSDRNASIHTLFNIRFCLHNTVSSIAACRAVTRLLEFNSNDVYVHSISAAIAGSNPTGARHAAPHLKSKKISLPRPEIRVTTEHITMAEFGDTRTSGTSSPYAKSEGHDMTYSTDMQSARYTDPEAIADIDKDDKASYEFPGA
ncbi:LOW QUALITY PROTEIN: hypothetical protein CVT25_011210 [Psilocybe cyanescens]|uniref:Uncharacterized protein n=1 Tax=Psilocybe cyanescens TaxID=93625 RepID=A0A409WH07_PSICY|nr:LOW QUALITY PROTEIN: hypothetical protein CVT25_011210 [Psilocybe cyanescens]